MRVSSTHRIKYLSENSNFPVGYKNSKPSFSLQSFPRLQSLDLVLLLASTPSAAYKRQRCGGGHSLLTSLLTQWRTTSPPLIGANGLQEDDPQRRRLGKSDSQIHQTDETNPTFVHQMLGWKNIHFQRALNRSQQPALPFSSTKNGLPSKLFARCKQNDNQDRPSKLHPLSNEYFGHSTQLSSPFSLTT